MHVQQLVETTPGSLLNDRKQSISNLEKQYAAPLGQRLVMGIQIDAKCLEGGVEAVSKRARQEKQMQLQMSNGGGSNASFAPDPNNVASADVQGNAGAPDDFSNNNTADGTDSFSFLNDSPQPKQQQRESSSGSRGRKFGMGFLKKVAARTTDTLERGMQGLAVRMDQGKNADLVRVAIYDPSTNDLLGVTESLPVPGMALAQSGDGEQQQSQQQPGDKPKDLRFEVPLWVPGSRRTHSLLLKVWIQSGATLVLQSAKSSKNYLLGSAMVNCQALSEGVTAVALNMTTTSTTLNGIPQQGPPPRLQLCVLPDPKFSPILTRGWSLTDPDMSGYSSTLNYLPLDQSYVFPGKQANHWLVAHERATESTLPLPIAASMTELAADACDRSLAHAQSVARILRNNRHDHKDPKHKATCELGILGVVAGPGYSVIPGVTKATVSAAWRRPDSIFEFEIAANQTIPAVGANGPTPGGYVSFRRTFYPKLCSPANGDHILPGILQAYGGRMPSIGCFLGGVYFSVDIQTPNSDGGGGSNSQQQSALMDPGDPFAPTSIVNEPGQQDQQQLWETVLGLEAFVKTTSAAQQGPGDMRIQTMQVPLRRGSEDVGYLLVQLQVTLPEGHTPTAANDANFANYMATLPATDGLVSLVGMDGLSDGVKPYLDSLPTDGNTSGLSQPQGGGDGGSNNLSATNLLRHQQLDTMGFFFTTQYMEQHLALRQSACDAFRDRARSYKYSLVQPEKNALPHTLRTPKNFRPSSSRTTTLLSGIPFNCHVASLNINVMDAIRPRQPAGGGAAPEYPGASFHNVTCGAPADHARGFGNILQNVSNRVASGGLRRLEAKRKEYSQLLQQAQSNLIAGIGSYLTEARKNAPAGSAVNHVPARHAQIQQLRWKVFECVHILHHITWMCAVRRANVFSQSLGLAVSSFLASLSDRTKCAAGWPAVWAQHGFLVCFEGLLSAAGKELGMIEDASVSIAMLRMVSVVLVPCKDENENPPKAVSIPSSPFLKWTKITAEGGDGSARKFVLKIGIDPAYYAERIPPALQGKPVRLYPILFEVGVDIRQWGANTGSNLRKNNAMGNNNSSVDQQPSVGSLVDDGDDDDAGIVDDDVLVALNYEAMRKMNCYAHALSPQQVPPEQVRLSTERVFESGGNSISISSTGINPDPSKDQLPIHPSLATLHSHILSSAGKMNHSILDEAATIAQQLGGGGLVFCKSGKDRTAMHLTYKQCQFAGRYRGNHDQSAILRDATLLRLHGTRLPICEKNVGQALYAFNSLQVKFMPEALKPPMDTLAGFLKGGEIFRGGSIES